jgi:hypothetical protein
MVGSTFIGDVDTHVYAKYENNQVVALAIDVCNVSFKPYDEEAENA